MPDKVLLSHNMFNNHAMKRICKVTYVVLFILTIPLIMVAGQDKSREQKIKVIVNDGSGSRVVIDTIYKDSQAPDSIKIKDGTVIYIKNHPGDEMDINQDDGRKQFFVTYSSDGKDNRRGSREITVISSDSIHVNKDGGSNHITYYNNSKSTNSSDREIEDTFDEYVSNGDNGSVVEKSRFVIARDGIVVTVEGNDEAKTKALVKEIENKMGVKNDASEKK
jgi:hypothetical protein